MTLFDLPRGVGIGFSFRQDWAVEKGSELSEFDFYEYTNDRGWVQPRIVLNFFVIDQQWDNLNIVSGLKHLNSQHVVPSSPDFLKYRAVT